MRKKDFDRFTRILSAEAEIRGVKPLSESALLLWWQRMERFEFERVKDALRRHAEDADRGRFMPQPADLVRFLEGSTADKAAQAWSKALTAAGSVDAYTDVVFDDAAIYAVITDLGGWPKFCACKTADLSYTQHKFHQAYMADMDATQFSYPSRLPGNRSPDDVYAARGLSPPALVFVDDMAKVRQVALSGAAPRAAGLMTRVAQRAFTCPLAAEGQLRPYVSSARQRNWRPRAHLVIGDGRDSHGLQHVMGSRSASINNRGDHG